MERPYIVNFFTQRDYEQIPELIESGANVEVTDPREYGEKCC